MKNAAILAFANARLTNAGNHVVVVRNGAGQATSQAATLTVNPVAPSALRIVRLQGVSAAVLDVEVSVAPGRNYVLEATGDLKTWTAVQSFSANQTVMTVRTVNSGATPRFFRVREGE